jgi:hypothetical protein
MSDLPARPYVRAFSPRRIQPVLQEAARFRGSSQIRGTPSPPHQPARGLVHLLNGRAASLSADVKFVKRNVMLLNRKEILASELQRDSSALCKILLVTIDSSK